MQKRKNSFLKILLVLSIIFFYMPILFMMIFSFNSTKSLTHFTGFSLKWYEAMIKNHSMMESLYITIIIAILATLIATMMGTITAIGLSQSGKKIRRFISIIDDFPLMNPDIVTAIGFMLLFITLNISKGFITLLLAHIAFCVPYVILSVMPKVKSLDPNLADAAMDLGASPARAIFQVIVPQIMPGIISGALIAFTMSFDDFIISYFVTGRGIKNLSIMVYTMSKRVNPSVNAINTVIVLLITAVLIIVNIRPMIKEKRMNQSKDLVIKKRWPTYLGSFVIASALIISLFGINSVSKKPFSGQTLHIYMPGEYISEDVITEFEKTTGAKVVMDNFESNEQMYIKVANGESYDLLIPSDYMIQRCIQENLLMKIDRSKLDDTFNVLNPSILDLSFDRKNQYSIPYFWGSVGICYDKRKVSLDDLEKQGFNIFLNTKYKGQIYLYDSERDSFMMALKALGYSMNTTSKKELNEAYNWLVKSVKTMSPEIVTDEIIDNMAHARKALGLVYSGDAAYIMSQNKNMGFYLPKSGTNIWTDSMCIPKNARNVNLAYEFMNYVTEEQTAIKNSEYVGYTSPNKEAALQLSQGTFKGNNAYIPRENYKNDEVFQYNEKTRKEIANLWSGVKISASNN